MDKDKITTYKELCVKLMLGYNDILDLVESTEITPQIILLRIKTISELSIEFYEDTYDRIEETLEPPNEDTDSELICIDSYREKEPQ